MQGQTGRRAAIYCRISETDESVDKVANQEADCRAHAKRRGYTIQDELVFSDDGISASKFLHRPEYERLLKAAETGRFDVLVATAEDRLSRQPQEKLKLAAICAESSILWDTLSEGVTDPSTDMGEFLSYFRGWTGRAEQREKAARIKRRFEQQRAEGLPLWGVRPFGFEVNRIDHRESEAEELRWAYQHVLDGGSLGSIMRSWSERGIKTTRGNAFSYATVRQALLRPRNAGLMERDGVVIEDAPVAWSPIVAREIWESACAVLTDPGRSTTDSREPRWLCSGLVYCWCGSSMRSGSGSDRKGRFPIYRCADRLGDGADGRRHVSIKPDDLDPLVRSAVAAAFLMSPPSSLPSKAADLAEVQRVQARRVEVRRSIDELVAMIGTPGITAATVTKRTAELGAELESLDARLEDHTRQSAHAAMLVDAHAALWAGQRPPRGAADRSKRIRIATAAKVKEQLEERFDSLPLQQRRTLVRTLLVVTVDPWQRGPSSDRVRIEHLVPELREI